MSAGSVEPERVVLNRPPIIAIYRVHDLSNPGPEGYGFGGVQTLRLLKTPNSQNDLGEYAEKRWPCINCLVSTVLTPIVIQMWSDCRNFCVSTPGFCISSWPIPTRSDLYIHLYIAGSGGARGNWARRWLGGVIGCALRVPRHRAL